MYPFNRLLVGLALRGKDEITLRSVALCAKMTQAKRVYFVHIVDRRRPREITPEEEHDKADGVTEYERIVNRMRALVEGVYGAPDDIDVRYEVLYGPRLNRTVEYAIDKDIDLIVIGSAEDASRVFPEKVARTAPCSVLIIPEAAQVSGLGRILVPTDFSKLSAEAMKVAISCCKLVDGESLIVHHVRPVRSSTKPSGSNGAGEAELKEQSRRDCDMFLEQFDIKGLPINMECGVGNEVVESIVESEKENDANVIFIGARGRSGASAFLLGSVTEKLIRTTSVPLMAVKKKGANLTLLQALFEL
jgi:nucleotide-binding universal stress UspA family protein